MATAIGRVLSSRRAIAERVSLVLTWVHLTGLLESGAIIQMPVLFTWRENPISIPRYIWVNLNKNRVRIQISLDRGG